MAHAASFLLEAYLLSKTPLEKAIAVGQSGTLTCSLRQ